MTTQEQKCNPSMVDDLGFGERLDRLEHNIGLLIDAHNRAHSPWNLGRPGFSESVERLKRATAEFPARPGDELSPVPVELCQCEGCRATRDPEINPPTPVYRVEFSGAGEAIVTRTDFNRGEIDEFVGDLQRMVDLMRIGFSGAGAGAREAHNALGHVIHHALAVSRNLDGLIAREAHEQTEAKIDASDIPF